MAASGNKTFTEFYDKFSFGATRGFLRIATRRPDLRDGFHWLTVVRSGLFPRVKQRWIQITFSGKVPAFRDSDCPMCGTLITPWFEWAHLMTECTQSSVAAARNRCLIPAIKRVRDELADFEIGKEFFSEKRGCAGENGLNGLAAIYLVGGTVNKFYGCTYHLGFGQVDLVPHKLGSPGCIYAASFFQEVAHLYAQRLGLTVCGEDPRLEGPF